VVLVVVVLVVVTEIDGSSFVGVGGHKYVCGEEVEWDWFAKAEGPIKNMERGGWTLFIRVYK